MAEAYAGSGPPPIPSGSLLRQDTDGKAIFRFEKTDTWGVTIERLGFTWKNQQGSPPNWPGIDSPDVFPDGRTDANYLNPGAVAILFSGPPYIQGQARETGYYHNHIADCYVERGWRGVAIDDTENHGLIAVWGTKIERCLFRRMTGAAISLRNRPGRGFGMPNNALRDIAFLTQGVANLEDMVRVSGQSALTMENIDLEGSRTRVIYADSSDLAIHNLHIEHLDLRGEYPRMMFLSGGQYLIRGMRVDGQIVAQVDSQGNGTFSTLVREANEARVTISGVRTVPFPPDGSIEGTLPGFIPLKGEAVLIGGTDATFFLLDRPRMPVYNPGERNAFEPPLHRPEWTYEALWTWKDQGANPTTPMVRAPMAKGKKDLTFASIPAGSAGVRQVDVAEAFPGDLVTLGPPPTLPMGLVASGFVQTRGLVTIRLYNASSNAITPPSGVWTVAVGGGPEAGSPQDTVIEALLVPPYDPRPEPNYD